MPTDSTSPLDLLPRSSDIHRYMGKLYRELSLLRRLLRLTQTAQSRQQQPEQPDRRREVSCGR